MIDQETLTALTGHPFLLNLSQAHLEVLARCSRQITVTPGQFLGRQREPANAFYLIESGKAVIDISARDQANVSVQTVGPGEVVGWSWLVPPHYWQFDARVIETVRALALDARALREECERDHELGYQLLKRLVTAIASRLSGTRLQLLDFHHG